MPRKRTVITLAAFAALALNGMTLTFMGTSLPAVQSYLGISIEQAGTLMAVLQAGFTVFSLVGGILSDCVRRELILMAGCLLLGAGCMLFGIDTAFIANLIIAWFMGAGIGCVLSGSNTLLVSLYPARKGTILNIHHVFFGLGSFIGPLLMGYLLAKGNWWRHGFTGVAAVFLTLSVFFVFAGGEKPASRSRALLGSQLSNLFKDAHFLVILAVNTLAVGNQIAVILLGVTYLIEAKQSSFVLAGSALSMFSVFMMLGRLICSRLTVTISHATIILTLLWLQLATLLVAWYADGWLAIAALAFSGFTFSGIYPTSLAMSGIFFPQVEGSALGILSTMGGFGSIILCWLTGYIAGLTDMESGFIVMIIACFIALLLFQLHHGSLCRRENFQFIVGVEETG